MSDPIACSHCQTLEAEVSRLRGELSRWGAPDRADTVRDALGVTRKEALILLLLYDANQPLTCNFIHLELWPRHSDPKGVHVYAHNIRSKLGEGVIETVARAGGYRISAVGRELVGKALGET